MSDRLSIRLWELNQAHAALTDRIWPAAKEALTAGKRLVVELRHETRSDEQNRLLHAAIGEIAQQKEWAGAKREPEVWKRLLTAAWCRANGEHVEILPALDGYGVDIVFRKTSQLTRAECADLITWIQAWAADNDVEAAQ